MNNPRLKPESKYRISTAAKLMNIPRSSLYNYIHNGEVKSMHAEHNGILKHFISGLEIIKFNNSRFYEA